MKTTSSLTLTVAVLYAALIFNPAWAAPPPNPTNSDDLRNTAGGTNALSLNSGSNNTGFGYNTLQDNTSGSENSAFGSRALWSNETGKQNTAMGFFALAANDNGRGNTANGYSALSDNNSGEYNTASGYKAHAKNRTGKFNTGIGAFAMWFTNEGDSNTAIGAFALLKNTTGINNTALGYGALYNNKTGSSNVAIGPSSGLSHTIGNNNVYLANAGAVSESNTIRIGSNHTRTFIAGIRARKTGVANAVPVIIDSTGQLGTINSSARFKQDIKDMAEVSHKLLELRPVTYRYKEADDNGDNPLEYGLIAEEVAQVYPDLVAYGADGQIETVQYHKLTPMLLNELIQVNDSLQTAVSKSASLAGQLKAEQIKNQQLAKEVAGLKAQSVKVAALEQQMAALQTQAKTIETLTARLSRLEARQMTALNH